MLGFLGKLERWRALTPTQRALHVRGAGALTVAHLGIRLGRLETSARLLGVRPSAPTGSCAIASAPVDDEVAEALVVANRLASRLGARNYCVRRSLILGHLLRRYSPVLRIGVKRVGRSEYTAHAWVEIGGRAVGDGERARDGFVPLGPVACPL